MANRPPMKKEQMDELLVGLIDSIEAVCNPTDEMGKKERKLALDAYLKKLHDALHYRSTEELPRGWRKVV